jgi:cell division protein FtsB
MEPLEREMRSEQGHGLVIAPGASHFDELLADLEKLRSENADLHKEIQQLRENDVAVTNWIDAVNTRTDATNSRIDYVADHLRKRADAVDDRCDCLNTQFRKLSEANNDALAPLRHQIATRLTTVVELQAQVAASRAECAELKKSFAGLTAELQKVKAQLAAESSARQAAEVVINAGQYALNTDRRLFLWLWGSKVAYNARIRTVVELEHFMRKFIDPTSQDFYPGKLAKFRSTYSDVDSITLADTQGFLTQVCNRWHSFQSAPGFINVLPAIVALKDIRMDDTHSELPSTTTAATLAAAATAAWAGLPHLSNDVAAVPRWLQDLTHADAFLQSVGM